MLLFLSLLSFPIVLRISLGTREQQLTIAFKSTPHSSSPFSTPCYLPRSLSEFNLTLQQRESREMLSHQFHVQFRASTRARVCVTRNRRASLNFQRNGQGKNKRRQSKCVRVCARARVCVSMCMHVRRCGDGT